MTDIKFSQAPEERNMFYTEDKDQNNFRLLVTNKQIQSTKKTHKQHKTGHLQFYTQKKYL